jgi:adenylate cyclase
MIDLGGFGIVALMACGMGAAVWLTDRHSPTSRALALFLALTGIAIVINVMAMPFYEHEPLPFWLRSLGFFEAFAFLAGTEWGLRVGRTVVRTETERRTGEWLLRVAQGLALVYATLSAALPELRSTELVNAFDLGEWPSRGFLLFATPAVLAGVLVIIAGVRVLRSRPDKAEASRILAMLAAMPLFTSAVVLPASVAPVVIALGELVFLVGLLHYLSIQGARGQFMARFLSPQVAELVRKRGMKNAMAHSRMTVSVVSCDIRGFTAFAQGRRPEAVLRMLRDYYAAVGAATERFGGTIKDLAGDGALILIGAPVPFADHAVRALALAQRLQARVRPVVVRYSQELGFGVGVASGEVAVGIVGQQARFEYVAVGPAVNLAARLCDKAADGEIRVDAATLDQAGVNPPGPPQYRRIKGLDAAVPTYVLNETAIQVPAPETGD